MLIELQTTYKQLKTNKLTTNIRSESQTFKCFTLKSLECFKRLYSIAL